MKRIKILDKEFERSISDEAIQKCIKEMGERMSRDLEGEDVLFMGILNGAFMFASDLFKQIDIQARITFVKLASYEGTVSTGNVKRLIGVNEDLQGKTVVVLEDIIDTGLTMDNIFRQLRGYDPKEVKVATMLFKPDAFRGDYKIDYIGMEIPNEFIVGYGLDYDGYGRNIKEIYTLVK